MIETENMSDNEIGLSDTISGVVNQLFMQFDPVWDPDKDVNSLGDSVIALDDVLIRDEEHRQYIERMKQAAKTSFNLLPADGSEEFAHGIAVAGACEALKQVGITPTKWIQPNSVTYYVAMGGALLKLTLILAAKPEHERMVDYLRRCYEAEGKNWLSYGID